MVAGEVDALIWLLFFSLLGDRVGQCWKEDSLPSIWQRGADFHGVHQVRQTDALVIFGQQDMSMLNLLTSFIA
jgi:hypothetical protein